MTTSQKIVFVFAVLLLIFSFLPLLTVSVPFPFDVTEGSGAEVVAGLAVALIGFVSNLFFGIGLLPCLIALAMLVFLAQRLSGKWRVALGCIAAGSTAAWFLLFLLHTK